MKKVLILGGSHRDIPLINASKELGYFVITLGDREYYLGHNYSDKAIKTNFNDLDAVRNIIKEENIDFIIPGSGEESYLNTVLLSHEFNMGNFDKLETAKLVHNKWKFKEFCLKNGISTPRGKFYKDKEDINNLNYPIVVKPTNLSGGRGVEIVNTKEELLLSINETKKVSDELFLEEYIEGKLIAYSILLINKKIAYGFLGEDVSYLNKYLITTAFPVEIENNTLEKLKNDIEKLSNLLGLVNGMFHLQVVIKKGIPYIIDVTRRIPGDLYPYLIEYCDRVEYSKSVVQSYINGKCPFNLEKKDKSNFVIRHCVMPSKNGVFKRLFIDDSIKESLLYRLDLIKKDSLIESYLNTQLAIVFIHLEFNDRDILDVINELIYPIIES